MPHSVTEKSLELVVRGRIAAAGLLRRSRERLGEEDGQTAAEYIGIILVVVAVIAAVVASGIGEAITDGITDAIKDVKGPKGGAGGGGGQE